METDRGTCFREGWKVWGLPAHITPGKAPTENPRELGLMIWGHELSIAFAGVDIFFMLILVLVSLFVRF